MRAVRRTEGSIAPLASRATPWAILALLLGLVAIHAMTTGHHTPVVPVSPGHVMSAEHAGPHPTPTYDPCEGSTAEAVCLAVLAAIVVLRALIRPAPLFSLSPAARRMPRPVVAMPGGAMVRAPTLSMLCLLRV